MSQGDKHSQVRDYDDIALSCDSLTQDQPHQNSNTLRIEQHFLGLEIRDMGSTSTSREIKSPEDLLETPTSLELDGKSRKKLGMFFIESDNRRTAFGRGYTGGTTPVNIHGKPIADLSKTGGWTAAFFIFGNEMAERMAYFGLSVNMVAFMFYVMHRPFSSSSNAVNNFLGISQASSVFGGFLADAYLGRYWTIAIFTTIYLAGLIGITLCASLKIFVPNQDQCDQLSLLLGSCEPAKPWQMLYLYIVLYITAFGAAGIRPCVSSFGADQFDERSTPLYRHRLPGGSPLTRVAQVLVAAFKKRHVPFTRSELVGLYELPGRQSAIKGSGKIPHTDDFRCLDKAALELKEDGGDPSPWRLCTVTQVEEVKILIKLIPIPACTIMLNAILTEFLTLSVQQAYTMNTHMGKLKLPVTCMPVFPGLSIFLILCLYYSVFVPISRRVTGHPHGASQLQRVGIGLFISILSVAWAGAFERFRRGYAITHGYEFNFLTPMPDLSAYWLLIQYCLIGIAEVFTVVGLLEFLYEEAPDAMKSIGSAYAALAGGLGCFVASIINSIVKSATRSPENKQLSWLSQNINQAKFDYFYWLLTVLSIINFCIFLYSAHRYKYRTEQTFEVRETKQIIPDEDS
ncbi:hypothetical protein V6N11_067392 [Hibiscus sabdariffa]|uniref:Protein NRT1/ PTR FAMILY 6.1 n=1 Tax=Hibiscus sabdariffa TaxID=183260 RepID=A0ABR2SRF4_9ROSI